MVKLLACGARGPGFDFPASPLEFSEIGYLLLPSRNMAEIPLNRRKFSKNQPNQQQFTNKVFLFQDSEAYSLLLEQIAPKESGVMSGPPLSVSFHGYIIV